MMWVLLRKLFHLAKLSLVHTSLDEGYRFRVRKCIWNVHFLQFSNWNEKPDSLLLYNINCWRNDQVSRSRLFCLEFALRIWILCASLFQLRKPPRNVEKNATLLSSCDPQHLPLCVPHLHLLFLIRTAFRVECFYVNVKRKILETLDIKIYTWMWHQVLGRCASQQYGISVCFLCLWKNWDIGYKTMFQLNNPSCAVPYCFL